jgi:hypothetical protein
LSGDGSGGQDWKTTSLLNPPNSVNNIGMSCYLEEISLTINDEAVEQVQVQQPFEQPGPAAFFVYTFDTTGKNGTKCASTIWRRGNRFSEGRGAIDGLTPAA